MKQTRIPNESGWFWYQPKDAKKRMVVVEVVVGATKSSLGDLCMRLPGAWHYSPVARMAGIWGDRISDPPPIEEKRVCDFCDKSWGLDLCQNCGKDICIAHRYDIGYQVGTVFTEVELCPICKDVFNVRLAACQTTILQELSMGKELR